MFPSKCIRYSIKSLLPRPEWFSRADVVATRIRCATTALESSTRIQNLNRKFLLNSNTGGPSRTRTYGMCNLHIFSHTENTLEEPRNGHSLASFME